LFIEEVTKTLLDRGVLRREPGGYRMVKGLTEVEVHKSIPLLDRGFDGRARGNSHRHPTLPGHPGHGHGDPQLGLRQARCSSSRAVEQSRGGLVEAGPSAHRILPAMSLPEAIETTRIPSVTGRATSPKFPGHT
jgi:hypothetical protein